MHRILSCTDRGSQAGADCSQTIVSVEYNDLKHTTTQGCPTRIRDSTASSRTGVASVTNSRRTTILRRVKGRIRGAWICKYGMGELTETLQVWPLAGLD